MQKLSCLPEVPCSPCSSDPDTFYQINILGREGKMPFSTCACPADSLLECQPTPALASLQRLQQPWGLSRSSFVRHCALVTWQPVLIGRQVLCPWPHMPCRVPLLESRTHRISDCWGPLETHRIPHNICCFPNILSHWTFSSKKSSQLIEKTEVGLLRVRGALKLTLLTHPPWSP